MVPFLGTDKESQSILIETSAKEVLSPAVAALPH
jgi:hypothetical protein